MAKKKLNYFRFVFLVLTVLFFVAGFLLVSLQIINYFQYKAENENVLPSEFTSEGGGIVSITIVEPPESESRENYLNP